MTDEIREQALLVAALIIELDQLAVCADAEYYRKFLVEAQDRAMEAKVRLRELISQHVIGAVYP